MPPMYTNITWEEMNIYLTSQGFTINKHSSLRDYNEEDSYDKIITHNNKQFAIRVYTSLIFGKSRDVGKDAIRVILFYVNKAGGYYKIGTDKRINRTQGWKVNLQKRIDRWNENIVWCADCGLPMIIRKRKFVATAKPFYGCIGYPDCKGTKQYAGLE
jgi:hypothetical protein